MGSIPVAISIIKSNIDFDLNGSTIKLFSNDEHRNAIIFMTGVKNVTVHNGTLIGDMKTHKCKTGGRWNADKGGCPNDPVNQKSHGSCHAVHIVNSVDIKITKLNMKELTGDGILVYASNMDPKIAHYPTKNITVSYNEVSNTGRNGISIISGEYITIDNNVFHDGKYGVCIEPIAELYSRVTTYNKLEYPYNFPVTNVKITNNKMYNNAHHKAATIHRSSKVKFENNKITDPVGAYVVNGNPKGFQDLNQVASELTVKNNKLLKEKNVKTYLESNFINSVCATCTFPWQSFNGKWYYVDEKTGSIVKNTWIQYNGHYYYFGSDGIMYASKKNVNINGKSYSFDENGNCTNC